VAGWGALAVAAVGAGGVVALLRGLLVWVVTMTAVRTRRPARREVCLRVLRLLLAPRVAEVAEPSSGDPS